MEYLIGLILAVGVAAFARISGFDRERAFYPTVLIVTASYYVLFAAMGASGRTVLTESMVATIFSALAVIGFRKNLWFAVAAMVGHGIFDLLHRVFIENPGVPLWWPGFCLAFDVVVGGWLGLRLLTSSNSSVNSDTRDRSAV